MALFCNKPLSATLFVSLSALMSGCNSGSSGNASLASRAIDGYLVGSQVLCDDEANGGTINGGYLTCPLGSKVVRVIGGSDVGFDETVDTGGTPFNGELSAPADLGFVTPLSTLAMQLSTESQLYNSIAWETSVETLATSLGQSSLDLSADAASVMQLVRLNAKVNQVISSFTVHPDDYIIVADSFAHYLEQQAASAQVVSLDEGVDKTMAALNEQLLTDEPRLHQSQEELQRNIINVTSVNLAIQQSLTPEPVAIAVSSNSSFGAAAAFDRQNTLLAFTSYDYSTDDNFTEEVSVENFESSAKVNGKYKTTLSENPDYFRFNHDALIFKENLQSQRASMAISVRATDPGDTRSLSLLSNDIYITGSTIDASDIQIDIDENSLLHATGTSSKGVETSTTVKMKDDRTFYSDRGVVGIHTFTARRKLQDLGFEDIFYKSGNFEVTIIIGGIQINEINLGVETAAKPYTVDTGDQVLTGSGFKGYISYIYR